MSILALESIVLDAKPADKAAAIRQAGQLLVDCGRVDPPYIEGMLMREATMSTYLGNGVAIPHGMHESIVHIRKTGISVVQIPDGIEWDGDEPVYLVIGIASGSDEHVEILSNLADAIEDEDEAMKLAKTTNANDILSALSGEAVAEG